MIIKKTVKIPIYYNTTKSKIDIVDSLTARLTYCIRLISGLITNDTKIDRKTIRAIVKNSDISSKTKLSSGFIDQCIDKVIWTWKSYNKLHKEWERKVDRINERIIAIDDEKKREKLLKSLQNTLRREPTQPIFQNKTSCRFDYRTGKIEWNENSKITALWVHVSTLMKNKTIDIPLNPSHYHIKQLKEAEINDFEIIRRNKKYYIHITITKIVEDKPINSIGGIDQGLNKTIAAVLLPLDGTNGASPHEEILLDAVKRELLEKYDEIVSSLQEAEKWDKLRLLRNKRENVSVYHDWCLANQVAEFTEGAYLAIGNSRFRQTQVRGNGHPILRKRIGKWSYGRQRIMISHKRAERGYPTELRDEYRTSRECHICHSLLTTRIWERGYSYILCHSCNGKIDADINAAYNISHRYRDDRLKAGMITWTNTCVSL